MPTPITSTHHYSSTAPPHLHSPVMAKLQLSLAVVALAAITMALLGVGVLAQDSPDEFLAPHDAARAEVGVGAMEWDEDVAAFARGYANERAGDCALQHSGGGPNGYGENIFWGGGSSWTATDAVAGWVAEKPNYDYDSNSCVNGECLHYTQVVWRDSVRLGCARVVCNSGDVFITCNYSPAGNWIGQRPY